MVVLNGCGHLNALSDGQMMMDKDQKEPGKIVWRQADGRPIGCDEKLKVLNENLEEIRQCCQDAFEDAVLMGCDEAQIREVLAKILTSVHNPYKKDV